MARSKIYLAHRAWTAARHRIPTQEESRAHINIAQEINGRRNPSGRVALDLRKWLGIFPDDEWVHACCSALRHLLQRGDVAVATCVNCNTSAIVPFFAFLRAFTSTTPPRGPGELEPRHLRQFEAWLMANRPARQLHHVLSTFKRVVLAMVELDLVKADPAQLFVTNPFAGRSIKAGPSKIGPLSDAEVERVVAGLKRELIALHRQQRECVERSAIIVYFLVIALRTGANMTPLLELARDALKPHLLPGMMRIDLVKHRGAKTYTTSLRQGPQIEDIDHLTIPIDGVAILNLVMKLTQRLAALAGDRLQNQVWLFEQDQEVKVLTVAAVLVETKQFVVRQRILGDDGTPLRLTTTRLRKTKAHQLMRLSDGDLTAVATVLGNTPIVADQHYLSITPAIRAAGAKFMGEVFNDLLLGSEPKPRPALENTPVARCKDTLRGEFAKHDGHTHCDQFIHCLSCPSFAIVGTLPDLYRLFSFKRYLLAEIGYYPDEGFAQWREHRLRMANLIEEFSAQHFASTLVSEAKGMAEDQPHKFWAVQLRTLERLAHRHG